MTQDKLMKLSWWLTAQADDLEDEAVSTAQIVSRLRRKAQGMRERVFEERRQITIDTASWYAIRDTMGADQ